MMGHEKFSKIFDRPQNINVVIGQLSCRQCKAKFLLETHCIDDQDKFQSVTDTDNEFTEY